MGQALGPAYGVKLYNIESDIGFGAWFFICQAGLFVVTVVFFVWVWKMGGGHDGSDGSKPPPTPSQHGKIQPEGWQERGDEEKRLVEEVELGTKTKRENL